MRAIAVSHTHTPLVYEYTRASEDVCSPTGSTTPFPCWAVRHRLKQLKLKRYLDRALLPLPHPLLPLILYSLILCSTNTESARLTWIQLYSRYLLTLLTQSLYLNSTVSLDLFGSRSQVCEYNLSTMWQGQAKLLQLLELYAQQGDASNQLRVRLIVRTARLSVTAALATAQLTQSATACCHC